MMQVPAWSRRGGHGVLPMKEMRISSGPSSSDPGKYTLLFFNVDNGW